MIHITVTVKEILSCASFQHGMEIWIIYMQNAQWAI